MNILIACEFSGITREAFAAKGHYVLSADLEPTEIEGHHYQGNVLDIINEGWDMMIAFPPCTYLAVSGARWMRDPQRINEQKKGIDFFITLAEANIPRICIENPLTIMTHRWKKPTQKIQPYYFGHPERKTTCLWLKNLPKLKPTKVIKETNNNIHMMPGTKDRSKKRSRMFSGIAHAMATQWGSGDLPPIKTKMKQCSFLE